MARKRTSESEIGPSQGAAVPRRKTAAPHKKHTPATSVAEPVAEPVSGSVPAPETSVAAPVYEPTREAIAALAYSYWVERGYEGGTPEEDWLRAERELCHAAPAGNA